MLLLKFLPYKMVIFGQIYHHSFHFQMHIHVHHLVIVEGVLPAGAPDTEVATKPPAQVAIYLDGG